MDGQPWLAGSDKILVVDLYDPFHLEQLELAREAAEHDVRVEVVASTVAVLNEQIARGDFFLCASEKQRDFWLGQLGGGRPRQSAHLRRRREPARPDRRRAVRRRRAHRR